MDEGHDPYAALTAAGTVLGSIAAIWAAVAAARSANAAREAIAQAALAERQRYERELARTANQVIAVSLAVTDLGDKLKIAYQSLFGFSGGRGGSREEVLRKAVETTQQGALEMQTAARQLLESRTTWKDNTDDVLSAHLSTHEGNVVHLDRVRRKFERELDGVEGQNAQYRERVLNSSPSS